MRAGVGIVSAATWNRAKKPAIDTEESCARLYRQFDVQSQEEGLQNCALSTQERMRRTGSGETDWL